MPITVNWANRIIYVPKSYMSVIQPSPDEVLRLDMNLFRATMRMLESTDDGIIFPVTHSHNPQVTIGNLTLSDVVEIINGYKITFENGNYAVELYGANTNLERCVTVNSVGVRSVNSAGMVTVTEWAIPVPPVPSGVQGSPYGPGGL